MTSNPRALLAVLAVTVGFTASPAAQQPPPTALLNTLMRDLACAPASPLVKPPMRLVIAGGREPKQTIFAPGDAVIIRGGATQGLKAGDEFYVRRLVDDKFTESSPGVYPISITTAGTVQIVETQAESAVAVVTYGCDAVMQGDYLEPFQPPNPPAAQVGTTPDYAHPGHLILFAERRQIAGTGSFMVLDRGSDHGVRPGQQLTIFRQTVGGAGPIANVAWATVYTVAPESSVVRLDKSVDSVHVGDLVAIHR
jgi:hypothetical protein